jgi:hypothetical protein
MLHNSGELMADINYQEVVNKASKGELLIGVEPALARRFFTDSDPQVLQREFGSSFSKERLLVRIVWLLEYPSLFAGLIASIFAFHWYSIIAILLMVVIAFMYGAKSSGGFQQIGGVLYFFIICLFLAYYFKNSGIAISIWFLLLPLPYLSAKLTYKLSTVLLRGLSLSNERLFNFLYDKAIFLKET